MTDGDNTVLDLADFDEAPDAPKEAPEAEAEQQVEEADGETDEAGENGTGEEGAEEAAKPEPKPKGKSVQDRIDKLTADRREAQREAEYWKNKALGKEPPEEAKPAVKTTDEGRPNPDDFDLGDVDSKYVEALAEWKARHIVESVLRERDEKTETEKVVSAFAERTAAARERYPDYEEVVAAAHDFPCSDAVQAAILRSEVGADLAYYLCSNEAETRRLATLHPTDQLRELGRIEAKLEAKLAPPPAVQPTRAPTPPKNHARGAGGQYATSESALYDKALQEMI